MKARVELKVVLVVITISLAIIARFFGETHSMSLLNLEFRNAIQKGNGVHFEAAVINESPYTFHDVTISFHFICEDEVFYQKTLKIGNVPFFSKRKISIEIPKPPCYVVKILYSISTKAFYGLMKCSKKFSEVVNIASPRKETTFLIDSLPKKIKRSSILYITGKLIVKETGEPVANAKILVYDYDEGLGDDLLTYGYTDSNGYFRIPWVAKRVDFPDMDAEIYLVFEGNIRYLPARWPEEGYHKVLIYEPVYPPPG